MKSLKLNKQITTFSGEIVPISNIDPTSFTVGKAIANILVSSKSKKFDHFKSWELGKKFYNQITIELDDSDFKAIEAIIGEDQAYSSLILGQVLEAMNNAKPIEMVKETKEIKDAAN